MGIHAYFQRRLSNEAQQDMTESLLVVNQQCDALQDVLEEAQPTKAMQRFAEAIAQCANAVNALEQRINAPSQPSLFSFDNQQHDNDRLSRELAETAKELEAMQVHNANLQARLTLLEEAHASLKTHNTQLQQRVDNMVQSFDATLGS